MTGAVGTGNIDGQSAIFEKEDAMDEGRQQVTRDSINFKPGVGSSYGNGWRQMWKYFLELLLIGIIGFVISIPVGMAGWSTVVPATTILSILGFVYSVLILGPVDYGVSYAHLKAARADSLKIEDMFEAFRNYLNAVLANILVGAIVVVGFMLIIIPGIIFACKLAFTPYLVTDRKMEVIEAVKESWRMTNGHAWTVFFIGLLAIPIFIVGLILFGVGIILSIMWIRLTIASLYHSVSLSGEGAAQERMISTN